MSSFRALSMKLETIIMHILNKFQENIMVGLWCLMPLSAIFQFISFYWWRKP
jgi:hypothetical protein